VGDSELPRRRVFSEVWSGGIPTALSVTVGREDLHPARNNIHLLVDALPPGQPYLEGNRRVTSRRKEKR
jgi:hypothetical protein